MFRIALCGVLCCALLGTTCGRKSVTLKLKRADPSWSSGQSFLEVGQRSRSSSNLRLQSKLTGTVTGPARSEFYVTVSIGTPPQQFLLAVDTGSGNIVVPSKQCPDMACKAHRAFDRFLSTSARDVVRLDEKEHHMISWPPRGDAEKIKLFFGSGYVNGQAVNDKVCVGPLTPGDHLCIRSSFVSSLEMTQEPWGLVPYDGVLGLGLLEVSVNPEFNLLGQFAGADMFEHDRFALWLAHKEDGEDSEMTLGDFREDRIASRVVWVKVTAHPGRARSGFWQVPVADIAIANGALGLGHHQAAVDTGTSVIAGPSAMITAIEAEIGLRKDCSNWEELPLVGFVIEGMTLNLEPTDYVLKDGDQCHSQFMPLDLPPPRGPLILLGDPFLRKYYTIFDRDTLKLGFGLAKHKTGAEQVNLLEWAHKMMVVNGER